MPVRFLLSILLFVALLGKGMVPAGYMVAERIGGGIELTLCSDEGAVSVTIGADGLPIEADSGGSRDTCPYCTAPVAMLAEARLAPQAPAVFVSAVEHANGRPLIAAVSLRSENAARAPPVNV